MTRHMRDYNLSKTLALPAGDEGGVSANGDAIDLGDASGEFLAGHELRLAVPALAVGELPDEAVLTVKVQDADDADFTENVRDVFGTVISVTGAAAGAEAAERRMVLPEDVKRYIRPVVASTAEAGDPSAKNLIYELLF